MDTAGFILIPRYFCFGSIRRPVRKAACHAGSQPKIKSLYFLYNYPQFLC